MQHNYYGGAILIYRGKEVWSSRQRSCIGSGGEANTGTSIGGAVVVYIYSGSTIIHL